MKFAPLLLLQAAPRSHEPQLIDLDGTFFIQLGILFLLMLFLTRLLWRPYLKVRTERVSRVEGYREQAVKLEADAQQRLERAEAALAEARARVAATVAAERGKLEASASATAREAARKILGREVSA